MRPIRLNRTTLFTLLMSLFVVIILEAVSYVAGAFLEKWSASIDVKRKYQIYYEQKEMISKMFRSDTNDIFDPDLGWAYRPNYHGRQYNNNSIGLRGTREYEPVPPQDIISSLALISFSSDLCPPICVGM